MRVTHPYHPLSGQELELVKTCRGWHEPRVCLQRADGQLTWLSRCWTSLEPLDPFLEVSAVHQGKGPASPEDLLGAT